MDHDPDTNWALVQILSILAQSRRVSTHLSHALAPRFAQKGTLPSLTSPSPLNYLHFTCTTSSPSRHACATDSRQMHTFLAKMDPLRRRRHRGSSSPG